MLIAFESRCVINAKSVEQLVIISYVKEEKIKTGATFLGIELTSTRKTTEYALKMVYRDEYNAQRVFKLTDDQPELLEKRLKLIVKQIKEYETHSINDAFEKVLNGDY